jgi:DNA mismatch repair protein MutS
LAELERGMHQHASSSPPAAESSPQLGLDTPTQSSAAERALEALDPDALTPREALDALYRLKSLS